MDIKKVARWVGLFSVPVVILGIGFYRSFGNLTEMRLLDLMGWQLAVWIGEGFGLAGLAVASAAVIVWAIAFVGPIVRGPV